MSDNSPEDLILAMRTALERGEYGTAQQLSLQAVKHYPKHEELTSWSINLMIQKVYFWLQFIDVLQISGGDTFATGAIRYDYRPVSATETTNRIILLVEIQGRMKAIALFKEANRHG